MKINELCLSCMKAWLKRGGMVEVRFSGDGLSINNQNISRDILRKTRIFVSIVSEANRFEESSLIVATEDCIHKSYEKEWTYPFRHAFSFLASEFEIVAFHGKKGD